MVLLDGEPREVFSQEQELREAYLEQPHVTRLAKKLGIKETLLTAEELIDYVKKPG
jgi:energy-coupling factor transport system ATP-binding protein